jgi:hypothetical protein
VPAAVDPVLPLADFDVMVRVWVSVHTRTASRLVRAFRAAGWDCVPDDSVRRSRTGPGERGLRSHWHVDVPLPGSPVRATVEAERLVVAKSAGFGPAFHCRGSRVLEPERVHARTFHVHNLPAPGLSRWRARIAHRQVKLGQADVHEIVHAHDLDYAREELRRRDHLPDSATRPGPVGLRAEAFAPPTPVPRPGLYRLRRIRSQVSRMVVVPVTSILAVESSAPLWSHGWPGAVGLLVFSLLLLSANFTAVRWAWRATASHQSQGDVFLAAVLTAASVGVGMYLGLAAPGALGWIAGLAAVLFGFIAWGIRDLVRGRGWRPVLLGLIPLILSLIPTVMAQIARLGYEQYLSHFHMSTADVTSTGLRQLQPALGPIAVATLGSAIFMAYTGFARRFHVDLGKLLLPPMLIIFAGLTIVAALDNGDRAGATGAARASSSAPTSWGSLSPQYVCPYPLSSQIPYAGIPLGPVHPMLTFDAQAPQVALWDPTRQAVTHVPGADLALRTVRGPKDPCPSPAQ